MTKHGQKQSFLFNFEILKLISLLNFVINVFRYFIKLFIIEVILCIFIEREQAILPVLQHKYFTVSYIR